jgi:hypothetical protein
MGTYRQFRWPCVIWERMIIARGLDSEDTEASARYARSALSCSSLRLEETDKAVRRLPKNEPPKNESPKNEPPKTLTGVNVILSMMRSTEGQIGEGNGSSDVLHISSIY